MIPNQGTDLSRAQRNSQGGRESPCILKQRETSGIQVAEEEMTQVYGGCCGVGRPESNLGGTKKGCGSPGWEVNMINLNLYMNDTPLWYESKLGPSVEISISYNSQSAINQNEPFGSKWILNYGTYLVVDTSGNVTIFMPDGRRDVYTKTTGGYTNPYQVFNTLTKIAENHFELKMPNNVIFVYNIPEGTSSLQPFLVEIRDTHNQNLTFGYDSNVRLTTITDALNRVTTLTYNEQNLVTLVTDPFNRTASFEYDANRNLTRITDMVGHSTTLTYGGSVYLTSLENQKGRWEFYIEPSDGIPSQNNEDYPPPGDHMWQNYRITVSNPSGDKGEYYFSGDWGDYSYYVAPKYYLPYSSGGNYYWMVPKTTYYNVWIGSRGEFSKIVDPEGRTVTYGYDAAGNRTSIQDAKGRTLTLTYDTKGNVTGATDSLGNSIQLTYDSNNNLTHVVDPKGNNYDLQYTGLDLTKIIDPKSGEINLTYNSYGQLLTLQDPKGNSTTYAYDTSGNLTTVSNPLTGQDLYTYDSIGWVATHTDPKNNTTSLVRDGLGRVTQVTYQDQSTKTFVYDCCSLGSVTDPNGTITFTYDTLKRLSSVTDIYGKVVSFGYDKNNNLTNLTYPDGKIVNYDYDYSGRLTKVTDWLNKITAYTYDVDGSLIKATPPDGSTVNYQYDNGGRLTNIADSKSDGSLISVYKYALDQLGNRTGISFSQPLNVKPTPPDASYTHDVDNRLLTAGSISFGYDNNGNLITKTLGSNVTNYSWDSNDMLGES
jgi:YD repeat-containing protein